MKNVVAWRRHLHMHPELSYHEKETAAFVAARLREAGWRVRTGVGGHGVVADLDGGAGPGKRIALRADMDALPIQDQKRVEYASTVPGVMHACGHDGHTAALLGAAVRLAAAREEWSGSVRLLFQPAEEIPPGGAKAMVEDGALEGVDEIYGIPLWSQFPACTVHAAPGPVMAASDEFSVTIRGKGGHGGLPHETVDTVVIGAHLVVNLQSIVSRNTDPIEPHVISVGAIRAGSTFNVIAEECTLQGTVRSMSEESRALLRRRLEEVARTTCAMFGASCEFEYHCGYPPVVNHAAQAERVLRLAAERFGRDRVFRMKPLMAGEDFAYYLERVPGCFIFVGAGGESARAPHHHPLFDIDERALQTSVDLLFDLAAKR